MFRNAKVFSSFSVDDGATAKNFYEQTLGLAVEETPMGLVIHLAGGGEAFIYPKGTEHQPATHTILNFVVEDIDEAVEELITRGVKMEQYSGELQTDAKGIMRGSAHERGPSIAWFKDPAGNTLSVLAD